MIAEPHIPGIEFGPMTVRDGPAVADLVAATFSRYEPMAVATGQSYAEFQALLGLLTAEAAFRDLSICARHAQTGAIVGVMLATDFMTKMPEGVEAASPSFAPVGGLIDQLEDQYRAAKAPQAGECLDLAILAVERSHGGQGIAQRLVSTCVQNGATEGYRRAITMATNRTSQHVFKKLGFIELFSVLYKDYTFAGKRVFASIESDDRTALMERVL